MSKKALYITLLLALIVILGVAFGMKYFPQPEWRCLAENEEAGFYNYSNIFQLKEGTPKEYPLKIILRDKNTKQEIENFQIDDLFEGHPLEVRKCGVYVFREFNFDKKKFEMLPGYSMTLWQYDYLGAGKKILTFREKDNNKDYDSRYSYSFSIDPLERYVVLEKGYLGQGDYSLVVKDLNTKEDVYVLSYQKVFEEHPEIVGGFWMREWSSDGRYFWGDIFMGAYVSAYFRIDTETWTYDLFDVLENQMGGDQLNPDTGWVTNRPGNFWTGEYESTEAIKAQMREDGVGTKFYLYNLITKEKILVAETDEPDFSFSPHWLSDTEIEYELPSGEKKTYELE